VSNPANAHPRAQLHSFFNWESALSALGPITHEHDGAIRSSCPVCNCGPRCLRVSQGRSQALARCYNGCSFFDIRDALFPGNGSCGRADTPAFSHRTTTKAPPKPRSKIVAKYLYDLCDPSGRVVITQVRYECAEIKPNGKRKKGFYYEHPDGRASHKLDEHDAHDLPLFHTEMVGQYPTADKIVVAGPKKSCVVQRNAPEGGFVVLATTQGENVFPNDAPLNILLGATPVYLIPDNNWVGLTHMERIARWLSERGQEHYIVESYPFGHDMDVGDFFESGGTFIQLREMMALARFPVLSPFDTQKMIIPGNDPFLPAENGSRFIVQTEDVPDSGPITEVQKIGLAKLPTSGADNVAPKLILPSSCGAKTPGNPHDRTKPGKLISMANYTRPGPRDFIIPGYIPSGAVSVLYGDAATFKTFLATAVSLHVVLGAPFCGLPVKVCGPAVYVDAELDPDEFARRAYRALEGMGLPGDRLPEGLHYINIAGGALSDAQLRKALCEQVAPVNPVLTVVDSWQFATGSNPMDQQETIRIFSALKDFGTVLMIDHERAPTADGSGNPRPYGNNYKFASLRSGLRLTKPSPGALVLSQGKLSFGRERERLAIKIDFKGDEDTGPVSFERGDIDDPIFTPPNRDDGPTSEMETLAKLKAHPAGALPSVLAKELNLAERTIKDHMTKLSKLRLAKQEKRGGPWMAA